MAFHRLTVPSYFGGLPGGFDYINTPSDPTVGGSGVPAPMDAKKTGGPNDGTYFVAFGEDARATFANRGMKALAQNTDNLDDVLRTSIPKIITTDLTAVGAVTTVALTGEIFVGEFGLANNATNRSLLVHVTEQATNDDLEVSGTKIVPTLIHDGASANVVGTIASGFRTNASVNFSPAIPNGTNYRVWYGIRSSLAEISATEKGAYFKYLIRTAEHMPGSARSLFRQLHSEASVNQAYTDPWDSTIRSLASSGLNERYRRATTQPAGFITANYNVAGGGAVILRDGPAVELQATTGYQFSGLTWPDGNKATLKLGVLDTRSNTSSFVSNNDGGDFGVWHESEWKPNNNVADTGMFLRFKTAGPALVDVIPYDMRAATFQGDTLQTSINASSATATLNPDSINTTSARRTVECGPGQYFSLTGPVRTAIRVGIDMLEVTDSSNRVRTFIIETIVSATRVRVIGYGGFAGTNLFAAAAEAGCKIRLLQMGASIGGPLSYENTGLLKRPLFIMPPAILTTVVANENIPGCSFFGSQTGSVVDATADARRARALEWGSTASPDSGAVVDGVITPRGWLKGDGSIHATALQLSTGSLLISAGDITLSAGGITLTVGGINTANDIHSSDDVVADDDLFAGDRLVVGGNATIAGSLAVNKPNFFYTFNEDWIRFTQTFAPNLLWTADHTWLFNEITNTFTLNNGTPSAKNPGKLQIIGAGGGTAKKLAIYPTSQFPFAFANIELLEVVIAVNDNAANNYSAISVGFFDATTTGTGNNVMSMVYFNDTWALLSIKGGVLGPNHFFTLGARVNDFFNVIRFVKTNGVDMEVYFNGVLATTILAAEIPSGNGTLLIFTEQTAGDANVTTWTVDDIAFRVSTAADRSGA